MTRWAYYNEWDAPTAAWLRELIARGLVAPGEVDTRSITEAQMWAWLDSLPSDEAAVVLVRAKAMEDREHAQTGEL